MSDDSRVHRFRLPIINTVIVFAALAGFAGFIGPVIHAEREASHVPTIGCLAQLAGLRAAWGSWFCLMFPLAVGGLFAAILVSVRAILPERSKSRLPWRAERTVRPPCDSNYSAWLGNVALGSAVASAMVLSFVAAHVRVDRMHNPPVVSWSGPAVEWIDPLTWFGFALCGLAVVACVPALSASWRCWRSRAGCALVLVILISVGCLGFLAVTSD